MIRTNNLQTPIRFQEMHMANAIFSEPEMRSPAELAIFMKEARGIRRLLLRDIIYLEADGNYVDVHLTTGRMVQRNSMSEILKCLPKGLFVMVNRSQAVNILMLDSIITDEVILGGKSFTLTKRYRTDLLQQLNIIAGR